MAELLEEQRGTLARDHGLSPRIVAAADSKSSVVDLNGLALEKLCAHKKETGSVGTGHADVVEEVSADVVIEAAPTDIQDPHRAVERLRTAFRTGKHAVCVNKAPLAVALPALLELADHNNVHFRFSGTVGGGIPVLDWARRCAEGDEVRGVRAILNGTTNFMLTRMAEGVDFDAALTEAQQKGYAEADPSMDVDGTDTAVKLVILANAVLGRRAVLSDVQTEGIRNVRPGSSARLIGEISDTLRVGPQEVDPASPLAVTGTLNAVTLSLKNSGDVTLVGRGAGGRETATSVIRDLISIWHQTWGQKR